jgi:hypothetical protein
MGYLTGGTEHAHIFLRGESRSDSELFPLPALVSDQRYATSRRVVEANWQTYVPSLRRDEGTTRSSVLGSTTIPAAVLFGLSGGRDMMQYVLLTLRLVIGAE